MGFFSFITQDTDESISNIYSNRGTFFVCMHDNQGNIWTEQNYEGYGVFGDKDYYELLAEMNGLKTRAEGIELAFSGKSCLFPNLTESIEWTWRNEEPQTCEYQGYFYDDYIDLQDDPSEDLRREEEYNWTQNEIQNEIDRKNEEN